MIRKSLTYLLVTLIAMQSFVAMADEHSSHQRGDQHIEIQHDSVLEALGDDSTTSDNTNADFSAAMDDCQHCCHCHSSCAVLVTCKSFAFSQGDKNHWKRSVDYYSMVISPALRPPIV
ncbi:hypothetical protein A9Q99_11785 [Gammaproteobacteria bacterium 45_16_T64]|nr:hypothetical protein A9Q99_11785 [Gammaproteobacteria bacterium 45_16_T64]